MYFAALLYQMLYLFYYLKGLPVLIYYYLDIEKKVI